MRTPLRPIKKIVQESLKASDEKVTRMSSAYGHPGIVADKIPLEILLLFLRTVTASLGQILPQPPWKIGFQGRVRCYSKSIVSKMQIPRKINFSA
jgi:hypothetical protein